MKTLIMATAVVSIVAASPVLAQDKMEKMSKMECSDAEMIKMNSKIDGMSAGSGKTMAMDQMELAKDSMAQSDMSGCSMHMNEAMGAMETK